MAQLDSLSPTPLKLLSSNCIQTHQAHMGVVPTIAVSGFTTLGNPTSSCPPPHPFNGKSSSPSSRQRSHGVTTGTKNGSTSTAITKQLLIVGKTCLPSTLVFSNSFEHYSCMQRGIISPLNLNTCLADITS